MSYGTEKIMFIVVSDEVYNTRGMDSRKKVSSIQSDGVPEIVQCVQNDEVVV